MAADKKRANILVVDDEYGVRQSFYMVLKSDYNILLAESAQEAIDTFSTNSVDLILLDILLPDSNGLELLESLKGMDPNAEIVMVTAVNDIQTAVNAIKLGAYEYIIKPFVVDEVITVIERALEKNTLLKEVAYLRNELQRYEPFEKMVGESKEMKKIFSMISTISKSDGTVLIQGESGTGKELVARAIYSRSSKSDKPFVVVNCAAIPEAIMESEIFGRTKGAFTGAVRTVMGKLEIASKGVVFFDDIDSLDYKMQGKLLRVLQEKEFERLGSNKIIKIDARFIAASNKDLEGMVSKKKFREDLYYRLNVLPVKLPPLRERKEDIPLLLDHFLRIYSKKANAQPKRFSKDAVKILMKYDWPGNIRELQNMVERIVTLCKDQIIRPKHIPMLSTARAEIKDMPLKKAVKEFERQYIGTVLKNVNWNKKKAAEKLGIHRNTLIGKLKELDLIL